LQINAIYYHLQTSPVTQTGSQTPIIHKDKLFPADSSPLRDENLRKMKVIINKTQTSSLWISGKERVAGVRAADGRVMGGCATGSRDRAGVSH
jgi:hypothetical protein